MLISEKLQEFKEIAYKNDDALPDDLVDLSSEVYVLADAVEELVIALSMTKQYIGPDITKHINRTLIRVRKILGVANE